MKDRITLLPGSFFNADEIPKCRDANDAFMVRNILHDWNEADVIRILSNLRKASGNTGCSILLVEIALPERTTTDLLKGKHLIDMHMMNMFDAQERVPSEWHAIMEKTGFKIFKFHPTRSISQVIEAKTI